jgi:hypothetical protein
MDLDGLILEIHRAAHDPLRWESGQGHEEERDFE